ncbi:hypothetical protein KJ603_02430 [Patescibacteria group bacterium]|nr:hypothetical protein [Patescibacteria group bacterium]
MGTDKTRIIITVVLFLGIFILPWWFLALLFILSFIKIKDFYEGLIFALIYDIFYMVDRNLFWGFPVFFISAGLIFVLCKMIRGQLRV